MLEIINNIKPFFEDCYRRINVREYARIAGISPPTASKLLSSYRAEGILLREKYRRDILYFANKDSKDFTDLSRLYWRRKLDELLSFIEGKLANPAIVLFGSLSKAESKSDSDIDIAIFAVKKTVDASSFEKALKRKIQIFWFGSLNDVKNKELLKNILNGYVLAGRL